MEPQLQQLADRLAITDVVNRYAEAIDRRDWDLLRTCFAPDGRIRGPRHELVGPDAIVADMQATTGATATTQHFIGNVRVEVDGDRAQARSYLIATSSHPGTRALRRMHATYEDELIRTDEGWRIALRTVRDPMVEPTRE